MGGFSKGYRMGFKEVLYDISYANVVLYSAVLPSYNTDKKKKKRADLGCGEEIKADDPKNWERLKGLMDSLG